ncbi:hypothetical protein AMECASPLE_024994 [Ameca splendens]|uniref:Uncharacterized protein n=1 Tax=Ameca splendens TaxID=208324 RepID=A0ABV0ZRM2_9TELE
MKSTSTTKVPVSETCSLSYNTSKEDNGAHFWCEAKLELGAEGPKPPPVVKSYDLIVTVHCLEPACEANSDAPSVKRHYFILTLMLLVSALV